MLNEHDQERFMRLWTSAEPAVANYVHALVRDRTSAKDVLQETALVLYRRFAEYNGERPFLAWALGIARLQVMAYWRDKARSRVAFDDDVLDRLTESWAELAPAAADRAIALTDCIKRLASHAQRVVHLRYFEELNSDEISQRVGTSAASIRVTLQRIREQLRACVERELAPGGEKS